MCVAVACWQISSNTMWSPQTFRRQLGGFNYSFNQRNRTCEIAMEFPTKCPSLPEISRIYLWIQVYFICASATYSGERKFHLRSKFKRVGQPQTDDEVRCGQRNFAAAHQKKKTKKREGRMFSLAPPWSVYRWTVKYVLDRRWLIHAFNRPISVAFSFAFWTVCLYIMRGYYQMATPAGQSP